MADEDTHSVHQSAPPNDEDSVPEGFDAVAYLQAYPDIAAAVKSGQWKSALHHYQMHGARENRLADKRYVQAATGVSTAGFPPGNVDRGFITSSGQFLVSGWVSDTDEAPIRQII